MFLEPVGSSSWYLRGRKGGGGLTARDQPLRTPCFLVAAASAAAPAVVDVLARYDAARVSATVASQTKLRPALQGISVRPSGLLPSDLTSPGRSLTVG